MRPESPALLWDARKATRLITQFVAKRTWEEYQSDPMLRRNRRELVWEVATRRIVDLAGELDRLLGDDANP